MSLEQLVRTFLFEPNKQLDYQQNPDLRWKSVQNGRFEIRLPIVSQVTRDFSFLVNISSNSMHKPTMGIYHQVKTRVAGVCYNTPHRNPTPGSRRFSALAHSHRFTDLEGDRHAEDVSARYPMPDDLLGGINQFLADVKIVTIPADWFNVPAEYGNGASQLTLWDERV